MVGGPSLAEDLTQDGVDDVSEPETKAKHSGKLLVRMPATLHDELAHAAEREGVSLNQLITSALASAIGWRKGDLGLERRADAAVAGSDAADTATEGRWPQARVTRMVLAANFALVLVAAFAAIVLLVMAWNGV